MAELYGTSGKGGTAHARGRRKNLLAVRAGDRATDGEPQAQARHVEFFLTAPEDRTIAGNSLRQLRPGAVRGLRQARDHDRMTAGATRESDASIGSNSQSSSARSSSSSSEAVGGRYSLSTCNRSRNTAWTSSSRTAPKNSRATSKSMRVRPVFTFADRLHETLRRTTGYTAASSTIRITPKVMRYCVPLTAKDRRGRTIETSNTRTESTVAGTAGRFRSEFLKKARRERRTSRGSRTP